jgi:ABC-type Zn uptake system ZnuABC Zn-binding protein ZnuA
VAAALLAAATVSCSGREPDRRCVAASLFPLFDVTRRVAGDRLRVELVLPVGQTTHYYDPSPKDVARLADAGLVFAVGLGLDGWLTPIVKSAGSGRARIFELGPLADPILVPGAPAGAGEAARVDPHFWLDPVRMVRIVDLVVEGCRNLDPEGAPGYLARGGEVKSALGHLHAELTRRSERWRGHKIVTFHGSLYYFAQRYGPEVTAVVEQVPGREPTAREIADLVTSVRGQNVAALFSEPQFDARAVEVIAREAGLPVHVVDPVGGSPATDSYEKLLRQVADALDRAIPAPIPSVKPSPSPTPRPATP